MYTWIGLLTGWISSTSGSIGYCLRDSKMLAVISLHLGVKASPALTWSFIIDRVTCHFLMFCCLSYYYWLLLFKLNLDILANVVRQKEQSKWTELKWEGKLLFTFATIIYLENQNDQLKSHYENNSLKFIDTKLINRNTFKVNI